MSILMLLAGIDIFCYFLLFFVILLFCYFVPNKFFANSLQIASKLLAIY